PIVRPSSSPINRYRAAGGPAGWPGLRGKDRAMNHCCGVRAVMFGVLLGLIGCAHHQTVRPQAGDEAERDVVADMKTVGEVTSVANAEPIQVSGVGLVVGLSGTGGVAPPGPYRSVLEQELKRQGVQNIAEVLNSPDASLVLVSGFIPPGAHKD